MGREFWCVDMKQIGSCWRDASISFDKKKRRLLIIVDNIKGNFMWSKAKSSRRLELSCYLRFWVHSASRICIWDQKSFVKNSGSKRFNIDSTQRRHLLLFIQLYAKICLELRLKAFFSLRSLGKQFRNDKKQKAS